MTKFTPLLGSKAIDDFIKSYVLDISREQKIKLVSALTGVSEIDKSVILNLAGVLPDSCSLELIAFLEVHIKHFCKSNVQANVSTVEKVNSNARLTRGIYRQCIMYSCSEAC